LNYNGKLILLAYPDTFVKTTQEFLCKLLPLVGLGTRHYIKAGHAALILIENETGKARYFDFGRYITPKGFGRLRGSNTDAELKIPFNAKISSEEKLENLNDFLLWLDQNPRKTHGSGRLLASLCDSVDFKKAEAYIFGLQDRGSIPYGAFNRNGSNCARFVTETLLASTDNEKIRKKLRKNKTFTPSTVGNVEVSASNGKIYEIFEGSISLYQSSALKENLVNYFDKNSKTHPEVENKKLKILQQSDSQKLTGIGCDAWFQLMPTTLPQNHFRIKRYDIYGNMDFDGVYKEPSGKFNFKRSFRFTYDSHCNYCHIIQDGTKFKFDIVATFATFNLRQKEHSA